MSERQIGRVISVDSFKVVVQLDEGLKGLYKSGFNDIYEIARINSYLIIPVGADRIVSIVTRVKIQDETEIERNSGHITLPKGQRYLVATMLGTIEGGDKYLQGIYNYPILDNPVWYVVKDELDLIFDKVEAESFNYERDYYLPIGTSPIFADYKIRINPDRLFAKHAAILGNTGSGKSCTVASIIQSLFAYDFGKGKRLQGAHFIVFDINGEYKRAFKGDAQENIYSNNALVNALCIDKEGLKVPFWFMNFDDFDFLFEPSANTQAPILKRSISIAKSQKLAIEAKLIPSTFLNWINSIILRSEDIPTFWKLGSADFPGTLDQIGGLDLGEYSQTELIGHLQAIAGQVPPKGSYDEPDIGVVNSAVEGIKVELGKYYTGARIKTSTQEKNIDLPVWFAYEKMMTTFMDDAINEQEVSNNRIREFVSTLRLRLQSYLNDRRIADPLLLNQQEEINDSLSIFLAFILGDLFKIHAPGRDDLFSTYFNKQVSKKEPEKVNEKIANQISIIDMSLLPYDVLATVTGIIGRLVLEFVSRFTDAERASFPVVIVLEEAQNYIPEKDRGERISISKRVFERIAREGRKYGLSLLVSSQRPSELSKTVLSQCNSFIVHRLQNPEDQKYVKELVSSANEDILQQLPILPQQHAIIMGDAVRTPVQMRVNSANPTPNSENPKFIANWLKAGDASFPRYEAISREWSGAEQTEGLAEA